jgi:lysozyme family protein
MRYGTKWPEYARQWDAMKINASRRTEFERYAGKLIRHKPQYAAIEEGTAHDGVGPEGQGVPWYMIAVLHLRESSADFNTYLGNGEPLNRKTRLVPKGRGPFASFYDGALDALKIDGLSNVLDWRLEKVLYYCELFNGAGYHNRDLPSPYIWGGTNQQKRGKYIADGRWSGTVMDTQPGCAPILAVMADMDRTIMFTRET